MKAEIMSMSKKAKRAESTFKKIDSEMQVIFLTKTESGVSVELEEKW